jgi:hypothetical protein
LYAQHVVVGREHIKRGFTRTRLSRDRNLRVVDSGEVAGTRWLVLFWLKREGVRVDTWHWGTGVVVVRLNRVEVLATLFLESVLTVEDQLEGIEWTRLIFVKFRKTQQQWGTRGTWGQRDVRIGNRSNVGRDSHRSIRKVPDTVQVTNNVRARFSAPHQFLNWVVVGQSDLFGGTSSRQRVGTSVLDLFDQVFVTLLRESSALFGVEVDVVTPNLERIKVSVIDTGQVKVQSNFVVLQGNQWQGQSWVSVKEEDQWQVNLRVVRGSRSHLTPVQLRGFIQVQFSVQSPPSLVVLVDSLTTDGQFNILDSRFRDPRIFGSVKRLFRSQFNVHVRDQITVSGDRDGDATVVCGGTVNSLFDVFHRKVGVAFVNRLEESDFWVTSQVDILGAIGDELHETSGHSVCFCTIGRDFFFG